MDTILEEGEPALRPHGRGVNRLELEALMQGVDLLDLDDLLQPPAWHADAACKEHPELSWFPEKGGKSRLSKGVCSTCMVRRECLDDALADRERDGVWGGTTPQERRRLRRSPTGEREAACRPPG